MYVWDVLNADLLENMEKLSTSIIILISLLVLTSYCIPINVTEITIIWTAFPHLVSSQKL